MKLRTCILFLCLMPFGCIESKQTTLKMPRDDGDGIDCTQSGCRGMYSGPEFVNGSDVAHQFSNSMSKAVGDKLKEFYRVEKYKMVDFTAVRMITNGMGSGVVEYILEVPFVSVASRCEAYTSFDHVGGWNHAPALERRKTELEDVTMEGHSLMISDLKTTPEGLQEYWIQWKNRKTQAECQ